MKTRGKSYGKASERANTAVLRVNIYIDERQAALKQISPFAKKLPKEKISHCINTGQKQKAI